MSTERENAMAKLYGEVITKVKAAEVLNCSRNTITKMVYDGKIRACCEGKRIDTRSIARYIDEDLQKEKFHIY